MSTKKEDNNVEEKMSMDFARNLTLLRKERNLSQKQAAADLGVSQALLSHYEKGVRECGLKFLIKAADYYNVTCDSLLGRGSEAEEEPSDEKQAAEFRRRTLGNSINTLIRTSQECGDETEKSVISCLMLSVYKLMRAMGLSRRSCDFSCAAKALADAAISMSEAKTMSEIETGSFTPEKNPFSENFEKQCEKLISDITGMSGE